VGRGSEASLPQAAPWGDHVQPLGWVDDLDDVLSSTAALISPLRIGSGVKIKVLEALARGLPVVGTPHGVLGLGVGESDGCLVGRSPDELAAQLVRCVNTGTNQRLSAAARSSWEARFSPAVVSPQYDRVLGLDPRKDAATG
jgi:glycosyltransferase involved in cell wall biosynthesis